MLNSAEIVVIGGGPGGMSAASYAARAGRMTLLIESMALGGQMMTINEIENYPGLPLASGFDLAAKMEDQMTSFGAGVEYALATGIEKKDRDIIVHTTAGDVTAKAVIIATGATHRHLEAVGEEEYAGRGVSYCATCDGPFYRGKRVVVVGGGDTALTEAIYLSKLASEVTIIHRRNEFRAQKALVDRLSSISNIKLELANNLKEIVGDESGVTGVILSDGKKIDAEGVFIFVGITPNSAFLKGTIDLDENGYVITDDSKKTSMEGVFAVGDVSTTHFRQVVTAAADGAIAAHMADSYLSNY